MAPLLAAFAEWVSADAWFAGERPSRSWGLLALGVPLYVIGAVVGQGSHEVLIVTHAAPGSELEVALGIVQKPLETTLHPPPNTLRVYNIRPTL